MAALEGLNVQVSLDNPRPATLSAMQELLARNPNRYHVAHIDGATLGDGGAIILEQDDGSPHAVTAAELGGALASGRSQRGR